MLNLKGKNSKTTQYAIGGVVGFIILVLWFSVPLMDKSAWNTAVPEGNPFKSKSVDLRGLSDGMGYESGAPGSPLSGEMTDNPATSGEDINSSLYSSGFDEMDDGEGAAGATVAVSKGSSKKHSASANAPRANAPHIGKLKKVASINSGGSGSGTSGKKHSKFFGGGNDKANFVENYNAPIGKVKKGSKLLASAKNAQEKSKKAADINLKGKDEAGRSGISEAFNKIANADNSELTSSLEDSANQSGIVAGSVNGDTLKKNAPDLNKNDFTPPTPASKEATYDTDKKMKEMLTKMVTTMLLKAILGPAFGGMSIMMASVMTMPKDSKGQALSTKDISKKD